ncbi:Arginyl-tRNA--protein transferase 1 [Allomyces arbusculus]|nr:Arginyl-tRNA--protein transferase 1 [Allomyces arbusculus]
MTQPSILSPLGADPHECGYCKSGRDTSISYGAWAHNLTCDDYQALIDRGWRRSGKYLYKPLMHKTCCPQYTIKLDALAFRPSKQHRQVLNKLRRFLDGEWVPAAADRVLGDAHGNDGPAPGHDADVPAVAPVAEDKAAVVVTKKRRTDLADQQAPPAVAATAAVEQQRTPPHAPSRAGKKHAATTKDAQPKPPKPPKNTPFDLDQAIADLVGKDRRKHSFRTTLEPASFTDAKFALYKKYQIAIHHDPPAKVTPRGFERFLIDSPLSSPGKVARSSSTTSPLIGSATPVAQPRFGSFHLCYYLDTQLIAVSVIDLLPLCVSAVYFFYDPDFSFLSLGKVSAMVEMQLARDERRALPNRVVDREPDRMRWYYMGYYLHKCQKMVYKAQFRPSFLLDPARYVWVPYEEALGVLDAAEDGFTTLVEPRVSRMTAPKGLGERVVEEEEADRLWIYEDGYVVPLKEFDDQETRPFVVECAAFMDAETAAHTVFTPR